MPTAQAITDTYEDVELWIYDICHKFHRQYGGEFEELVSLSHEAFMEAYWSFDKSQSSFTNWTYQKVRSKLLDWKRRQAKRASIAKMAPLSFQSTEHGEADMKFSYTPRLPLQDEISQDAREVIDLALRLPTTLKIEAKRNGGKGRHFRKCLYDYLRGLEWSRQRILEAFDEVREVIAQ